MDVKQTLDVDLTRYFGPSQKVEARLPDGSEPNLAHMAQGGG